MRRCTVLALAGLLAGTASAAMAACPPGAKCVEAPPPPPKAAPARPVSHPVVAPVFRPAPAAPIQGAPPRREVRVLPRPRPTPPPVNALMIHRDANGGYTRHYIGAQGTAPHRAAGGPTYLYHGHSYAPFRARPYRWPSGEGYRRFHRHNRFPRVFLIPEYFIDNYDDYGLSPPPPNAQWLRYGDDLVLVDLDTGDILNVVPGAFVASGDQPPGDGAPPPDDAPSDVTPPP